jgi:hypothetical protein
MNRLIVLLLCVLIGCEAEHKRPPRLKRSQNAVRQFKREHPCPANGHRKGPCPGYVVDHIIPLACGGKDAPTNMQWQTVEEAKLKDKWERKGCSERR